MEWLVLGIIFLIVALTTWGVIADHKRRKVMTEEEWEQRERGVSLLGAGAMGIHKILHTDLEKAAATLEDARQGMLPSAAEEHNRAKQEDRKKESEAV
jgi:hypothetical protein